jgi:glycosyltransferase involved in cell wall biosynthesis
MNPGAGTPVEKAAMKFLMVTHYFGSHQGGIELVAERLFRGLIRRQCEVVWAAANVTDAPAEMACGTSLPLTTWNALEAIAGLPFPIPNSGALKQLFSQVGRADIVLLHDCLYLSNIAAFLRARTLGVPVMIVQHIGIIPYRNFLMRAIMRLANALVTRPMLASAQQVIFISHNTASYFASVRFRQPPRVVFNGVDTTLFSPLRDGEDKERIRDQMGLPRRGIVPLFVGRFVEKKGISAMKRMVEMRPDWTWAFAGWGHLDPRSWNARNVRVFSRLRGALMAPLYRACDVLVLPSTGEGFPLVIQEALACGLPVVCGAETLAADEAMRAFVQEAPVYVGDDDRTASEFLRAIGDFLDSGAELKNKSEERHAFAVSRYSWDYATEQYLEIASSLVPCVVSHPREIQTGGGEGCR